MRTNIDTILVNPNTVIHLMDKSAKLLGGNIMLINRKYSVTREAWISSVLLLGLNKITKKSWWLRVNPQQNAVEDLFGTAFEPIAESASIKKEISIQVFEIRPNSGTIFSEIKKKIDKHDLKGCSLVGYLMRTEMVLWKELNMKLMRLSPNLNDIWLIGNTGNRKFIIGEVYPHFGHPVEINLNDCYQIPNQRKFIQSIRVSATEASKKGSLIVPLGKTVILKPDFSFEEIT